MPGHDIVVMGCSAGGTEAFTEVFRNLPGNFPAAIFLVQHVPALGKSWLPRIVSRAGKIPASHAHDGEPIRHGRVYVAPPDRHLLLGRGVMVLGHGPRENGHRPAVDPLFRSAAAAYGPRVVAVVLSGGLDDGTAGLITVKQRGGVAVVQDPDDAADPGMARSAIRSVQVDHVLPAAKIAPLLVRLAGETVQEDGFPMAQMPVSQDSALRGTEDLDRKSPSGPPSVFTCPECGGCLWEITDGRLKRYACHVGHSYTEESMVEEQGKAVEHAMWAAVRILEERLVLAERMADKAHRDGRQLSVTQFERFADDARQRAGMIRSVLVATKADNGERQTGTES